MNRLVGHIKKASALIGVTTRLTKDLQAKRIMVQFTNKTGLLYFGEINTQDNDSRLVRGITLATGYRDTNYCFGAHDSYDIAVVQRLGQVEVPDRQSDSHRWLIMQFDLHTATSLPHILISRRSAAEAMYANFLDVNRDMLEHVFASPDDHHEQFTKQFVTFAPPAHAPTVEHIVSPEFTSAIVGHFKHLMIEIEGDSVYLFVDDPVITTPFLNKMLHYGLQFAKHIDERVGA